MLETVGRSKRIEQVRSGLGKLSRSKKNVLLIGESGVGKGAIGERIHLESKESKKPCASISLDSMDEAKFSDLVDSIIDKRQFRNGTFHFAARFVNSTEQLRQFALSYDIYPIQKLMILLTKCQARGTTDAYVQPQSGPRNDCGCRGCQADC